ncbi:MAG: hypothetical protein OXG82_01460 [Gammaproteobacteria bacterium]|nr:hypothetical protein [Gammaproteobacteria bacterium]
MKSYTRDRIKNFAPVTRLLDLPECPLVSKVYLKPHGRRLADGKVICWGLSRDWKTVLMAVFERAHADESAEPFAAVIMFPVGKCRQPAYRRMIETASNKLGIQRLEWYEE